MARARARFGLAILVDCHSMPSTLAENGPLDVVLGDRFGASAAGWIVDALESALLAQGYRVRRNKPYAGGHIVERHGAPARALHAVQIEINRALYMDERAIVRSARAEALSEALLAAAEALVARIVEQSGGGRLAAE
jgi:N-formylglutamate amidohydrolase